MRFDWDPKKAASNLKKHGIAFEEAASVFADPLGRLVEDALYGDRMVMIGVSGKRRLLFTVFAEVAEDAIRIISARRVTSHERRYYEEGT